MTFVLTIPEEMRQKYIERRGLDFETLKAALAKGDLEMFFKVGHQLKGNAATFGYETLGTLGEKMEQASESGNSADAKACLDELEAWLSGQRTR